MAMHAIITGSEGKVGTADIDHLYDRFISTERLARHAERTSLQVLGEIDGLMSLVDKALDSSERYHGRLCRHVRGRAAARPTARSCANGSRLW